MADRIVVMNRGLIEQIGAPAEVYESPAPPFVCQFLGAVNAPRILMRSPWGRHTNP